MTDVPGIIEHFPYLGLFLLLILGGIGFPFPEDITLILCGFLISTGVVKPFYGLLIVYTGLLIADLSLYFIGRRYGRRILNHKRFRKVLSPKRLSALEYKFNKRGILFMLLGRQLVGLRAQIFLAAGVAGMSPLKFLMADALSSIITMTIMIGAGYLWGNSLEIIKKDITRIEHIGTLLIVILLAIYLIFRYFKFREDKIFL